MSKVSSNAHIFQISTSPGGVPKRSVPSAEVTSLGLTGDIQLDKVHHGGPDRAVCLFSLEHILALQAEGHPIYPGSIGENVTVAGLDWSQMVPGTRLRLGEHVELEITSYAAPCSNIAGSFAESRFGRVSHKSNPGWARAYARVLGTGSIAPGDPIVVL